MSDQPPSDAAKSPEPSAGVVPVSASPVAAGRGRRWKSSGPVGRRWVTQAIVSGVAIVIVVGFVVGMRMADTIGLRPRFVSSSGEISVDGGNPPPGHLPFGAEIACGAGSTMRLRYDDGSLMDIGADTQLRVDRRDGGRALVLPKGVFGARIAAQPDGRPMRISTPHGEFLIMEGKLALTVTADASLLTVDEGSVEMRGTDRPPQTVGAGKEGFLGADPAAK